MKKAALPGTDLVLSRLGFGAASLHHIIGTRRQQDLLAIAADVGITRFNTARMYGEGMAERALGSFLARGPSPFMIATTRAASAATRRFAMTPGECRRALTARLGRHLHDLLRGTPE